MNGDFSGQRVPVRGWSRGRWSLAAAVVVAASWGGATAWAQHGPDGHDGGPPMEGGMWGGGHGRMEHRIDRMLDGLHVSDAQRASIHKIVAAAETDIHAQRDATRGLHQKALAVFTAPTVDAAAAENVRMQMVAQHDQSSRRMLQAMLDISQVLTPEQRAKLGVRMQEHAEMMGDRMQRMRAEHPAGQRP